jgi:hypothetical protein
MSFDLYHLIKIMPNILIAVLFLKKIICWLVFQRKHFNQNMEYASVVRALQVQAFSILCIAAACSVVSTKRKE